MYPEDSCLRMVYNLTEDAIRPFVVGRKNFLFCDCVAGAHDSANLYNLLETAIANGFEPYRHLKQAFTELPMATSVEAIEPRCHYLGSPSRL